MSDAPELQESRDHNWRVIHNFDHQSRFPYSSVSGQTKRDGDPGIIRALKAYIEQEGFVDITFYDAEQLAEMIGFISPATAAQLRQKIEELELQLELSRSIVWKKAEDAVKMARVRDGQKAAS